MPMRCCRIRTLYSIRVLAQVGQSGTRDVPVEIDDAAGNLEVAFDHVFISEDRCLQPLCDPRFRDIEEFQAAFRFMFRSRSVCPTTSLVLTPKDGAPQPTAWYFQATEPSRKSTCCVRPPATGGAGKRRSNHVEVPVIRTVGDIDLADTPIDVLLAATAPNRRSDLKST